MFSVSLALSCALFAAVLPASAQRGPDDGAAPTTELRFGVFPFYDAKTTIRVFQPLAGYLSSELGQPVRLVSAESRDSFLAHALAGSYDLLWTTNEVYLILRDRGAASALARGEPSFHGIVVVRADSAYRGVADLAGARIAAVSPQSVAGFLFLRGLFADLGLDVYEDAEVGFPAKIESIPFLVLTGRADAGVFVEHKYDGSAAYEKAMHSLRVIARSVPIPQFPFLAASGLDPGAAAAARAALARIDGSNGFERAFLDELGIERVVAVGDDAYDEFSAFYRTMRR